MAFFQPCIDDVNNLVLFVRQPPIACLGRKVVHSLPILKRKIEREQHLGSLLGEIGTPGRNHPGENVRVVIGGRCAHIPIMCQPMAVHAALRTHRAGSGDVNVCIDQAGQYREAAILELGPRWERAAARGT